ncbi:hypothetical protein [Methanoplanus endosymbiosus]|uniref:Uncharacterized protein n=1 Tax=Methanoplanus endosymbiosus TaxID=33865 RepID=A0A9E7PKX8_9EURY|nr:hypothetical protein [Methanoplanus endosymbiosus]UUX92059.1 hypothetical protein L6E24_11950 [Methanoplanus endosymbiosus]
MSEFEGFEITFRGGGAEDQLMISQMIEELNKQGIEAHQDHDLEEQFFDTWWKAKLWMIPHLFPYCRENEDSCFDLMELECPLCEGFFKGCKGCMSKICNKRCVCVLYDSDSGEIIPPVEWHYVQPEDRFVYNNFCLR